MNVFILTTLTLLSLSLLAKTLHSFTITGFVQSYAGYHLLPALFNVFFTLALVTHISSWIGLLILTVSLASSLQELSEQSGTLLRKRERYLFFGWIIGCLLSTVFVLYFDFIAVMIDVLNYRIRKFTLSMFYAILLFLIVIVTVYLLRTTKRQFYYFYESNAKKIIATSLVASIALGVRVVEFLIYAFTPYVS